MLANFRQMVLPRSAICAAFAASLAAASCAQDAAPGDDPIVELRALRHTIEFQSQQISALTEQVARLTARLEGRTAPAAPVEAAAPEEPAAPAETPTPSGPSHTVGKGETLTSIAKRYNITVGDLLNANKIRDARKIQIGQVLQIPNQTTPQPTP
jgi:LysM repeat protein